MSPLLKWNLKVVVLALLILFSSFCLIVHSQVSGSEIRLTNNPADQFDPAISGNLVAYSDRRNADADIYLYNITSGVEKQITSGGGDQLLPCISGRARYSMSQGISHCITFNPSDQYLHDMSGNRVVYTDNRNGNLDVYLYTITSFPREAEIGYDDGSGETYVMVHQTQYLRLRFLLTDFQYAGLFLIKTVEICWGSTSSDFTAMIRLRHYNTTKVITVANVTNPASGWQSYDVHTSEFVDNHFYVEIWQTSGYGYILGDTTAPQNRSQTSSDGGLTWSASAPNMNFMIRVVILKPRHDIAISSLRTSKTIIGQGYPLSVNITSENQGDLTDTFNVTLSIARLLYVQLHKFTNITLADGNKTTSTYVCQTSSWTYGNSTLSASASLIPHEANVSNNSQRAGILITIPGDVNGDKTVNVLDLILIATHLGHHAGDYTAYSSDWYTFNNCDINSDSQVNVLDLITCATHLGQHW